MQRPSLINSRHGHRCALPETTARELHGGLSGPAIRPVAVRMVWQTAKAVQLPIIGMGGIVTGEDALEFILAGASAVAVGTANFIDPRATLNVIESIETFMREQGVGDIKSLIGGVNV
jgi:dihydroorotate dehydrogenase (NAD+) catalytic subunit